MLILRAGDHDYKATVHTDGTVSIEDGSPIPLRATGAGMVRVGSGSGQQAWVAASGSTRWVFLNGEVFELDAQDARRRRPAATAHAALVAPMPATVVRVDVAPGATVRKGDTLLILEAMKMELPIRAPADGVVRAVLCRARDLVKPGVPLVEME